MAQRSYLWAAAVAGAAVLALEVLAARLMAPVLGSGSVSWAALLAVALGGLAVGSLFGGRLTSRASPPVALAWSLAVAAVYLVFLSQSQYALLRWVAGADLIVAELLAALVIQAVPLIALGAATPVVLHAGRDANGRWAGTVLAAGSGGGIVGALAAGLFLLPALGIERSLLALAAVVAGAAVPVAFCGRARFAALVALGTIGIAVWCWARHSSTGVVESYYGQLEVRTSEIDKTLTIDGLPQTGLPRRLAAGEALEYGYLLEVSLAVRPEAKSALVVGLGGGLAPNVLARRGVKCQAVEIDPAVIEIARREFAFAGDVATGDGRAVLERSETRYDLIFLDACTADRLPWHLFTLEALRLVERRINADGILVIQFIGDDGPWSASLVNTVRTAFGATSNRCLLLAGRMDRSPVGPRWLFVGKNGLPQLPGGFAANHSRSWRRLPLPDDGALLTDDHFAAEWAWAAAARHWRSVYGN